MVYCIFKTQYEPHPLPILKFRTYGNHTIETCRTPLTLHDNDTTSSSLMVSPPATVPKTRLLSFITPVGGVAAPE